MSRLITARAKWTLTSPGGSLTFNDRTKRAAVIEGTGGPWYRLIGVKGLRAIPDLDDIREDKTEAPDEQRYKEYGRGKTLSCTAQIFGRTFVEAHEGADDFLNVVAPHIDNGDVMPIFVVIEPLIAGATDQSLFGCTCRAAEAVENVEGIVPNKVPSPYFFDVTFDLRMDNPRFAAWDPDTMTAGAMKW